MTLSRLKTILTCQLLFLSLFFGLVVPCCLAGEGIAPDRNISLVQSDPGSPAWKILWDKARIFTRDGKFMLAAQTYADLLQSKPNIEEAIWEYCKILLKIEDYATAGRLVGSLLEKDPNNSDYLLAAGAVAMHDKNYEAASRYYGKIFEKNPTGENSNAALLGLANSLQKEGKTALAFSLFEQFLTRQPEDRAVMRQMALDAKELGKKQKARNLFSKLVKRPDVDDQILSLAVEIFDAPGEEVIQSKLLTKYLQRHPAHISSRRKLAAIYLKHGEFAEALAQLNYLIDNVADNDDYLLQAGTLCQDRLNMPEKALSFFEKYQQKYPEDANVKRKIITLRSSLARQLLAAVKRNGAGQLWDALEEVKTSRPVIYQEMAELLENKGESKVLIDVLQTLYQKSSATDALALRLARLCYKLDRYTETLEYLQHVSGKTSRTKSYLLLKGQTQQQLGLEMAALGSFEEGLSLDPGDLQLRRSCLTLAGRTGDAGKLTALFQAGLDEGQAVPADLTYAYLDLLSYNFLFGEYRRIDSWARTYYKGSAETLIRLDLHKASALRREGKLRAAEQLLRRQLTGGLLPDEVLFQLTENAVIDKNITAAKSWYQALKEITVGSGAEFPQDRKGCRLLLLKVGILKSEDEFGSAQSLINAYLKAAKKIRKSEESQVDLQQLKKQQCWLYFLNGKLTEADELCRELGEESSYDPDLLVLQGMISRKLTSQDFNEAIKGKLSVAAHPIVSRLLALAEKELDHQQLDPAASHLKMALQQYPDSVVGRALQSALFSARGVKEGSSQLLADLLLRFPDEPYFINKMIEIDALGGNYKQAIALLAEKTGGYKNISRLAAELRAKDDTEGLLTLARLLWGDKQREKSLHIYQQLLSTPVLEQLSDRFRQERIDYHYLNREDTFWNSIMLMLQSEPEILAELMEPPFLLDNRTNETGKIVAGFYEEYSWQTLISDEYMARKAIFDRNYYYAEQSYKKLQETNSPESMSDLAAIYAKIGKYRKEAQIYEAMQNKGASAPGLAESMQRNALQISPQAIFNAAYEERSGREGTIDMARTTIGSSFWMTPDLNKDIRFLYANNRFQSLDTEQTTGSNLIYGLVGYDFTKAYEVTLGMGAEKVYGNSDARYQYEIQLKGQLDDYINAHLLLEKRQVYDTIAAIDQQISYQSLEAGISIETPIGLSLGGDIGHRYYNDNNSQNRFHGFSSYTIFGDSLQLALRYDYTYFTTEDELSVLPDATNREDFEKTVYWSPASFSEHRMGLRFQHDFLGYEKASKKSMSYYAIESGMSLEDNENVSFTTKLDIFLEMSPHFLLKGNFTLSKSEEYDETGLSLSLHYRW